MIQQALHDDNVGFVPLRKACPTEQRLIARYTHGYYNNIVVAAIYTFPSALSSPAVTTLDLYARALRVCVDSHPCLSATYSKSDTGATSFRRVDHIDLRNHFNVLSPSMDATDPAEDEVVTALLLRLHNEPGLSFFSVRKSIPHWRLDLCQLPDSQGLQRVLISFAYDHVLGDGMSGKVFHRTFLKALNAHPSTSNASTETSFATRPSELAVLPRIPVTLPYLLMPALGHYLPTFLSRWLGIRASVSGSDADTWTGSNTFANTSGVLNPTAVQISTIGKRTLRALLDVCKKHNVKLTSLLNELVSRCFSARLPTCSQYSAEKNNFISCIPTDIRQTVGVSSDTMGIFASAAYLRLARPSSHHDNNNLDIDQAVWDAARDSAAEIAKSRFSITNQPIGLLAWISDIDAWCGQSIGKPREGSWEISNLLSFNPELSTSGSGTRTAEVEKMFFCQPVDATGWPLVFNVVSVDGGDMTICVSWQPGSLALNETDQGLEEREQDFVALILQDLRLYMEQVATCS